MILLIIEDDALFAELVTLAINAREVMVAGTMRQGFAMIELQTPDFIVLDLTLPDSTPARTISLIPELKAKSNGAVVTVVTGNENPEMRRQARACGADHFLLKDPGEELVRNLAARHSKVEPCSSRSTVEQIEKQVAQMTGSAVPFTPPPMPREVLKKVPPILTGEG